MKKGTAFFVLVMALLFAGCSQKEGQEDIGEETSVSETANDTVVEDSQWYPRGEQIEGQCFQQILEPIGKVSFLSCWPGEAAGENGDAVFLIEKNGVIWQQLEGMEESNIREKLVLNQVKAVSFEDSNRDGYDDIILICSYEDGKNADYNEVRYYQGSKTGSFNLQRDLSADMTKELEVYNIAAAKAYLKEAFGFQDEMQNEPYVVVERVPGTEEQLALICEYVDLWRGEEEYVTYNYAVTDLDQNGRLEVLAAYITGTGLYTYITCFEVSADGLGMDEVILSDLGSSPDIIENTVTVYCDSAKSRYRYLFDDTVRISASELVNMQMIVEKVEQDLLVECLAYEGISAGEEDETHAYFTMGGEELTRSAYDGLADERYQELDKRTARFNWIYLDAELLDVFFTPEFYPELERSWRGFDIY